MTTRGCNSLFFMAITDGNHMKHHELEVQVLQNIHAPQMSKIAATTKPLDFSPLNARVKGDF